MSDGTAEEVEVVAEVVVEVALELATVLVTVLDEVLVVELNLMWPLCFIVACQEENSDKD